MNYWISGTLFLVLMFVIYSSTLYRTAYKSGQNSRPIDHTDEVEHETQRLRLMQYRAAAEEPRPGDDCLVLDYSTYPPSIRPAQVIEFNEETNQISYTCHGDTYPITGILHDGIVVMMDYCQEC